MEIVNFFEKLAGRWFSQRTTHDLCAQQSKAGKSDLELEWLPAGDSSIQSLCADVGQPDAVALGGLKIIQKSTIEGHPQQQVQTTLVVPLQPHTSSTQDPETGNPVEGSFLRSAPPGQTLVGQYRLEKDSLMVLSTPVGESVMEERWWFITDNLRMRTGLLTRPDGTQLASFCSEIRLGGGKPPAS